MDERESGSVAQIYKGIGMEIYDGPWLEEDGGSPFPVFGLILPSLGDPKYGVAAFDQVFRECEAYRREGEFVICISNFMEISLPRNGQTKRERRIQIESLPSQFPDMFRPKCVREFEVLEFI